MVSPYFCRTTPVYYTHLDLVQPHAALLLLTGDLDLNEEIPAAQLFDAPAGLQWEADPIL